MTQTRKQQEQTGDNHGKDHAGKYLEEYPDVFAEISNVLVFGKEVVKPEQLLQGPTESIYKAEDGKQFMEQRRDTTKYVQELGTIISLIGFDNQSQEDEDMVIRVMGYDYASYRSQIKAGKERYPIITVVLYFGDKKWTKAKTLKALFGEDSFPYAEYVSDYKIRVIDVPRIPKRKREQLKGDFRVVADFFAYRHKKNYKPSTQTIQHVEAVLKMLEVFTGDERYGIIEEDILKDKEKGKVISMCEVLDRAENHGIKKGVSQEKEHGIKSLVESLRKFNISDMGIIEELIDKYSLSKTAARKYL